MRVNVLCGCGWGLLGVDVSEVPAECPVCGFAFEQPDIGEPEPPSEEDMEDMAAEYEPQPDDSMDGDHESALRDAGFGTDEDYGSYGGGGDDW